MTRTLLIAVLLFTASCTSHHQQQEAAKPEIPNALKEEGTMKSYVSRNKGRGDLVQQLYDELVEKDSVLRKLENQLEVLSASRFDSLNVFNVYDGKNTDYYSTATDYLSRCHDTVLAARIKEQLLQSLKQYNLTTKQHEDLKASIERNTLQLEDLHTILKVMKTLPVIEKYQHDQQPSLAPMQHYQHQQQTAIKSEESLLNK